MVKFSKCPRCGCEGIHACMGENSVNNGLDLNNPAMYNRLKDAIEHIRKSEAERKHDDSSSSS